MTDPHAIWHQATDDRLIERLIEAMQHAAVTTLNESDQAVSEVALPAPELATALLNLLASILEPAPACRTPAGMRKVAEAVKKELLVLMRGCRSLTKSDANAIR